MSAGFSYKRFSSQPHRLKFFRRAVVFLLSALLVLSGCLPLWLASPTPTASPPLPTATSPVSPTPSTQAPVTPTVSEPLVLWLPPQFDPESGSRAGNLLKERLEAFEQENQIEIRVRLKAVSGPAGLLDALTLTSAAAPAALPSVVLLPRRDLEDAALKGIIYPLDGLSTAIDTSDWYDYARELALVQGSVYGLPMAGDSLGLVYRSEWLAHSPNSWQEILEQRYTFTFPAQENQSLVTLALYLSAGGDTQDTQRRPLLEETPLQTVFTWYRSAAERAVIPIWTAQVETYSQAWQAYQDQRTTMVVAWVSTYLSDFPPDSLFAPLPSLGDAPASLATGWVLAVAEPDPQRRVLAARLCEWLTQSDFLGAWSDAAGVLPVRPSAFPLWKNQSFVPVFQRMAETARPIPSNEVITVLGPVLRESTLEVLQLKTLPAPAAQNAAKKVANPGVK